MFSSNFQNNLRKNYSSDGNFIENIPFIGYKTTFLRMIDYENEAAEVRARINSLLKEKGVTQNAVAAGDAPAQKRLNSQLSHGAAISLDSVLRVLNACPDVSADWLLRGSGDIYIANGACSTGKVTGAEKVTGKNATIIGQQSATLSEDFVRDMLAEKDKQIQTLLALLGK